MKKYFFSLVILKFILINGEKRSESFLDSEEIFKYPRVENFHPPKGYLPVKGYEPLNYHPAVNNVLHKNGLIKVVINYDPFVITKPVFDDSNKPIFYNQNNNIPINVEQKNTNEKNHDINRLPSQFTKKPSFFQQLGKNFFYTGSKLENIGTFFIDDRFNGQQSIFNAQFKNPYVTENNFNPTNYFGIQNQEVNAPSLQLANHQFQTFNQQNHLLNSNNQILINNLNSPFLRPTLPNHFIFSSMGL